MNFVNNETLKLWILWKVRFSKCEFLDELRIFATVWSASFLILCQKVKSVWAKNENSVSASHSDADFFWGIFQSWKNWHQNVKEDRRARENQQPCCTCYLPLATVAIAIVIQITSGRFSMHFFQMVWCWRYKKRAAAFAIHLSPL